MGLEEIFAAFFVEDITADSEVLARVWGVVTPPAVDVAKSVTSLVGLPEFNLEQVSESRFEGGFNGFELPGIYTVDFFALDENLNVSKGSRTTVEKSLFPNTLIISVFLAETSEPLEGASVTIEPFIDGPLFTEASGLLVVAPIQAGSYEIGVTFAGYPSQSQQVVFTAESIQALGFGLALDTEEPTGCAARGASNTRQPGDALVAVFFAIFLWYAKRIRAPKVDSF